MRVEGRHTHASAISAPRNTTGFAFEVIPTPYTLYIHTPPTHTVFRGQGRHTRASSACSSPETPGFRVQRFGFRTHAHLLSSPRHRTHQRGSSRSTLDSCTPANRTRRRTPDARGAPQAAGRRRRPAAEHTPPPASSPRHPTAGRGQGKSRRARSPPLTPPATLPPRATTEPWRDTRTRNPMHPLRS